MAPSTSQLAAQLRQIIYYHLDNSFFSNALFFAGRLHALEPRGVDAIHLISLCHLRLGQFKAAYDYSRLIALRGLHLGCSYVFAQACLSLERYTDGVTALEKSRQLWEGKNHFNKHSEAVRRHTPDAAAVQCLLGKLYHGNSDTKRAVDCYVQALSLNPFMWDAFENLCNTGTNIRTANVFKASPDMMALLTSNTSTTSTSHTSEEDQRSIQGPLHSQPPNTLPHLTTPTNDPFQQTKQIDDAALIGGSRLFSKMNVGAPVTNTTNNNPPSAVVETPPAYALHGDDYTNKSEATSAPSNHSLEPPNAPLRKSRSQAMPMDRATDLTKSRSLSTRTQGKSMSEDNEAIELGKVGATRLNQHKRSMSGTMSQGAPAPATDQAEAPQQRRSRRLFNRPNAARPATTAPTNVPAKEVLEPRKVKATGTRGRATAISTVGRVVSGNRKAGEGFDNSGKEAKPSINTTEIATVAQKQPVQDSNKDYEAYQWILDLLGKLGQGYFSLSRYQCSDALHHFSSLPAQQRETPWVLAQIGRAHYEQTKYLEAEKCFARIKKMTPSRIEDMEIYSTVLWHLKNDTELAFLAHELVDSNRLSPQAWCTIGNSFSLQRDHDQALKCFKRATQLDPKFAYGYTLQGHEHVANEEFDKALLAYRKAIGADQRHYNGWYGLGKVYEKMGKYEMAEKHYRAAASINPTNAILNTCIGVVLEKLKRPQAALHQFDHACELAPNAAISRFKKARVLLNLQRTREALEEFKILKDMAPDESNVHFMLGRVYKILHDKPSAIKHFTIALNLDPKAAQYIKEAMETLDDDDDGDEDEEMS